MRVQSSELRVAEGAGLARARPTRPWHPAVGGGSLSVRVAGGFPGSAGNGVIRSRRAERLLLYFVPIPDIILTVGLTNEAETR